MAAALSAEVEELIREKLRKSEFEGPEELTEAVVQVLAAYDVMVTPSQVQEIIARLQPGVPKLADPDAAPS
jgi:hypothetical protein